MATDASEAEWIGPRLVGSFGAVGLQVPTGYPAYARICHPVEDSTGRVVTWGGVAAETGREAHPLMQWSALTGPLDSGELGVSLWSGSDPEVGNLAPETLLFLLELLKDYTFTSEDCYFCLWDGWGWIYGSPSVGVMSSREVTDEARTAQEPLQIPEPIPPAFSRTDLARPRVHHPHRDYLFLSGPLRAATELGWHMTPDYFIGQSPNLFWPADQAWCVATEIDFDSTLVAGPVELVQAILKAPALDSWPIQPDDSLAIDGDLINSGPR